MSDDLGQPRLGKHGGPRKRGERNPETMPTGVRRDYIVRRLQRDGRHDLAQAIREGRVSAYSVAVELGWTKRAEPLGSGSVNAAKRRQYRLRTLMNGGALPRTGAGGGLDASQMMELWLGPNRSQGSLFSSRAELEAAWREHGAQVMAMWGRGGRRPQIWWELAAPALGLKWPGYFNEQSYLHDAGALAAEEKAELERQWKVEFERAQTPDFTLNDGGGEILVGDCARVAHYRWADIPDKLVKRWTAARRRRERQSAAPSAPQEEAAAK
jgi:hypothetical protein